MNSTLATATTGSRKPVIDQILDTVKVTTVVLLGLFVLGYSWLILFGIGLTPKEVQL